MNTFTIDVTSKLQLEFSNHNFKVYQDEQIYDSPPYIKGSTAYINTPNGTFKYRYSNGVIKPMNRKVSLISTPSYLYYLGKYIEVEDDKYTNGLYTFIHYEDYTYVMENLVYTKIIVKKDGTDLLVLPNWQSFDEVSRIDGDQVRGGTYGNIFVDAIRKDNYIYIFYTRIFDTRKIHYDGKKFPNSYGYPPYLCSKILMAPSGQYYWGNLCVDRLNLDTLKLERYYNNQFSKDNVYNTALLDRSSVYGRITQIKNDLYLYFAQAAGFDGVDIYRSSDLIQWDFVSNLPIGKAFYPYLERVNPNDDSKYNLYFVKQLGLTNSINSCLISMNVKLLEK